MTNRTNDLLLLEITDQLPLRSGMENDGDYEAYFEKSPDMRLFADQIPYIIGTDHSIYLQEIFDIIGQEFDAASVHQVRTVKDAVTRLQRRVESLIQREHLRSSGAKD